MIETPRIVDTEAQMAAVIHLTVSRDEIQDVMGPAFQELLDVVTAQGIAPAGPWFTHHLRLDPDVFDFEVGLPVTTAVAAEGRVRPGWLPAGRVAQTVYHGDYEELGVAWAEFDAWIAAQGYTPGPDVWERYLTGPDTSPDPADWRTELNRPLVGPA
ncbi:GyrI-like domain-containing protein [Thermomicrobiaceae bacterium CFH 74404]|uniref:GyrI-like domain-containing protein n=1 Tax=Thermalbibacter longus TaxID=2951981 RepID=A0AA41WCY4_9BACT|nr:GyrI-like domain-containing protein [Thermalbibacter longus]MCM8747763.1 GyrI-like domain-containing protein [Thermalbibacter longus]